MIQFEMAKEINGFLRALLQDSSAASIQRRWRQQRTRLNQVRA